MQTRFLTLGEMDDRIGNAMSMLLNNSHWDMPVTENPKLDSVEIWSLANFTDDSHPIHLHLVRFQILDRRRFELRLLLQRRPGAIHRARQPPAANEAGWKDTVRARSRDGHPHHHSHLKDIPAATSGTATFSNMKTTK